MNDFINSKLSKALVNKISLSNLPTKIHKLENISKKINRNLWIKRDDEIGVSFGGSKIRKLEYLFKEALDSNSDGIITSGNIHSNQVRQSISCANILNLKSYVVLHKEGNSLNKTEENEISVESSDLSSSTYFLSKILGADIQLTSTSEERYKIVENKLQEFTNKSLKYFDVNKQEMNLNDILGYISLYNEILQQEKEMKIYFDSIFLASSSLQTYSGMIIASLLYPALPKKKIYCLDTSMKNFTLSYNKLNNYIKIFNKAFSLNLEIKESEFLYSNISSIRNTNNEAINLFLQNESIFLDPFYSGKAAKKMLEILETKEIQHKNENILFLHTGGNTNIFNFKENELF